LIEQALTGSTETPSTNGKQSDIYMKSYQSKNKADITHNKRLHISKEELSP
jgi:hypothetical protein